MSNFNLSDWFYINFSPSTYRVTGIIAYAGIGYGAVSLIKAVKKQKTQSSIKKN